MAPQPEYVSVLADLITSILREIPGITNAQLRGQFYGIKIALAKEHPEWKRGSPMHQWKAEERLWMKYYGNKGYATFKGIRPHEVDIGSNIAEDDTSKPNSQINPLENITDKGSKEKPRWKSGTPEKLIAKHANIKDNLPRGVASISRISLGSLIQQAPGQQASIPVISNGPLKDIQGSSCASSTELKRKFDEGGVEVEDAIVRKKMSIPFMVSKQQQLPAKILNAAESTTGSNEIQQGVTMNVEHGFKNKKPNFSEHLHDKPSLDQNGYPRYGVWAQLQVKTRAFLDLTNENMLHFVRAVERELNCGLRYLCDEQSGIFMVVAAPLLCQQWEDPKVISAMERAFVFLKWWAEKLRSLSVMKSQVWPNLLECFEEWRTKCPTKDLGVTSIYWNPGFSNEGVIGINFMTSQSAGNSWNGTVGERHTTQQGIEIVKDDGNDIRRIINQMRVEKAMREAGLKES